MQPVDCTRKLTFTGDNSIKVGLSGNLWQATGKAQPSSAGCPDAGWLSTSGKGFCRGRASVMSRRMFIIQLNFNIFKNYENETVSFYEDFYFGVRCLRKEFNAKIDLEALKIVGFGRKILGRELKKD